MKEKDTEERKIVVRKKAEPHKILLDAMREKGAKIALEEYRQTSCYREEQRIKLSFARFEGVRDGDGKYIKCIKDVEAQCKCKKGVDGKCLTGIDFSEADLSDVDCLGAVFIGCIFHNVRLSRYNKDPTKNRQIDMHGAIFEGENLSFIDFSNLDLRCCSFERCILSGAKFLNSSLIDVNFSSAILVGALFNGARLKRGANDQEIDELEKLGRSNKIGYPNFKDAEVEGADFSGVQTTVGRDGSGEKILINELEAKILREAKNVEKIILRNDNKARKLTQEDTEELIMEELAMEEVAMEEVDLSRSSENFLVRALARPKTPHRPLGVQTHQGISSETPSAGILKSNTPPPSKRDENSKSSTPFSQSKTGGKKK